MMIAVTSFAALEIYAVRIAYDVVSSIRMWCPSQTVTYDIVCDHDEQLEHTISYALMYDINWLYDIAHTYRLQIPTDWFTDDFKMHSYLCTGIHDSTAYNIQQFNTRVRTVRYRQNTLQPRLVWLRNVSSGVLGYCFLRNWTKLEDDQWHMISI